MTLAPDLASIAPSKRPRGARASTRPGVPLAAALVSLVAVVLSGCANRQPSPTSGSVTVDMSAVAGWAWIDKGHILISRAVNEGDPATRYRLSEVDIATGAFQTIELPQIQDCIRTDYLLPTRATDGRIVAVRRCIPRAVSGDWPTWIVDVTLEPALSVELTPDLSPGKVLNVSSVSWDSSAERGVVAFGSLICQTIAGVSKAGLSPLDITVGDGATFNVGDRLAGGLRLDCSDTGQADHPSLGVGDIVAFDASAAAMGLSGEARLSVPGEVYTASFDGGMARALVRVRQPISGLAIAPSGACMAIGGILDGPGEGTFLIRMDGSSPRRVLMDAVNPRWQPDGSGLGGIRIPPSGVPELVIASVGCD